MALNRAHHDPHAHRTRLLAGAAAALLVLVACVELWPAPTEAPPADVVYRVGQETITIDEIRPTRQAQKAPPPPAPPIPIVVPDDVILDDYDLELSDTFLLADAIGDDTEFVDGEGDEDAAAVVEIGPKPLRFVEPEYPRDARRRQIRAEFDVEVTVNEQGRVEALEIIDRFLLEGETDDRKQPVAEVGYGMEEAALAAARRFLFRPARRNGTPVRGTTMLILGIGV